jgi:elongator complex protein 3
MLIFKPNIETYNMEKLGREIIDAILAGKIKTKDKHSMEKTRLAGKYGLDAVPRNSDILNCATEEEYNVILPLLQKKPMRTMSGVAIIAAMTKPHECPHGKCIYCPGGIDCEVPQSYTGKEPAARRAIMHEYDPYNQVHARLEQLDAIGHPIDKCELITMGGTLPSLEYEYQDYFIRECLRAMNDYPKSKKAYGNLKKIQETNEKSNVRCVGMTFETRPDYALQEQVDNMLKLGGTKIELGVQTLRDEVYEMVNRGHNVADVANATHVCRDALLKIGYQMMPGLFAEMQQDVKMFKELFSDERFKPDLLKFYPTLVIKGTKLYEMWKKGEYKPYQTEDAVKVLAKIKKIVPPWCRVIRIQRDIPTNLVVDGVTKSNLRELVEEEMKAHGDSCKCIRCREVGIKMSKEGIKPDPGSIELQRIDYEANGGQEAFLSFEEKTNNLLVGFLRLRKPSGEAHRPEMGEAGGIRELQVYGPMVEIGEKAKEKWQHRGHGQAVLAEAERIASEEWGLKKVNVISGIGVRDYYRKWGYERAGPYMSKGL